MFYGCHVQNVAYTVAELRHTGYVNEQFNSIQFMLIPYKGYSSYNS